MTGQKSHDLQQMLQQICPSCRKINQVTHFHKLWFPAKSVTWKWHICLETHFGRECGNWGTFRIPQVSQTTRTSLLSSLSDKSRIHHFQSSYLFCEAPFDGLSFFWELCSLAFNFWCFLWSCWHAASGPGRWSGKRFHCVLDRLGDSCGNVLPQRAGVYADLQLSLDMSLFVLSITYKFQLTLQLAAAVASGKSCFVLSGMSCSLIFHLLARLISSIHSRRGSHPVV